MSLKNYLRVSLPEVPASCDFSGPPAAILDDVMLNDEIGDCVIAGGYHLVGLETANAGGAGFHASRAEILADYHAIGGYVEGDPSTDQGCNEQDALNYWTSHGFANGTKLLGWLAVDGTNVDEVRAAMFLFENLVFGVELPDAWISPFPTGPGFVWDVEGAADPSNGHCFVGTGYGSKGVQICTWGMTGLVTYNAIAAYASTRGDGELYVMLSPDQLAKGQAKAPNGVDWTSLLADWDAMGGRVPIAPPPAPPPSPPDGSVSLEDAQAWAIDGLRTQHRILTRGAAAAAVTRALAAHWPGR
jgi:hypothetical protein